MTVVIVAAVAVVFLLMYGYVSNIRLKAEFYEVKEGGKTGGRVRIVLLADLHGACFGTANARLLKLVKEQNPDLICIAGDMTVKDGGGIDTSLALCKELVSVCPVYYAPGNHEIRMEAYEEYVAALKHEGVNWLDNAHKSFCVRGEKLCIYGLNLEERHYRKFWEPDEVSGETIQENLGECDDSGLCVLLAHDPEYFEEYCDWGADLILSGHVHGGIMKLPVLGGVIAPSLRLFPKYDSGRFQRGKTVMVLTRGLGTHHIRLRFFNVPELSVIDVSLD